MTATTLLQPTVKLGEDVFLLPTQMKMIFFALLKDAVVRFEYVYAGSHTAGWNASSATD